MAHAKVVVDGKVLMDGDTGQYSLVPRELEPILEQVQQRGFQAEMWMWDVHWHVTLAGLGKPHTVEVRTHDGGYTLEVNYG
jgi:hypothetical protein